MVMSDFDRFVIRHGLMPTYNPDTLIWVHGSYCDVPAEYSARVFSKGGEFVNE